MSKIPIILPAKLPDWDRIKKITKLAYQTPNKGQTLTTTSTESPDIIKSFSNKEFFALVAMVNHKIIGAIRYKINKNVVSFFRLVVLKTYRHKGIATKLIEKVEKIARRKGCNKIILDCMQEKKLPGFYQKLGYKIDKIKKHLDHHDVFMSKKI